MSNDNKVKKKGFLARLVEKLDKKMQEQANSKPCCSTNDSSKKGSCCSK